MQKAPARGLLFWACQSLSSVGASKIDFEVMRSGNGVVIVRWDFLKTQLQVQRAGRLHIVQGVKQYMAVAGLAGQVKGA